MQLLEALDADQQLVGGGGEALAQRGRLRGDVVGAPGHDQRRRARRRGAPSRASAATARSRTQLQRGADLQLLDVLGEVARGHALVDVLVAGERVELLDARLHVVPGDPLARGDRGEVDLVEDRLVGLDDAVGDVDAEVALGPQHREPQLPLEHDLCSGDQSAPVGARRSGRRGRSGVVTRPLSPFSLRRRTSRTRPSSSRTRPWRLTLRTIVPGRARASPAPGRPPRPRSRGGRRAPRIARPGEVARADHGGAAHDARALADHGADGAAGRRRGPRASRRARRRRPTATTSQPSRIARERRARSSRRRAVGSGRSMPPAEVGEAHPRLLEQGLGQLRQDVGSGGVTGPSPRRSSPRACSGVSAPRRRLGILAVDRSDEEHARHEDVGIATHERVDPLAHRAESAADQHDGDVVLARQQVDGVGVLHGGDPLGDAHLRARAAPELQDDGVAVGCSASALGRTTNHASRSPTSGPSGGRAVAGSTPIVRPIALQGARGATCRACTSARSISGNSGRDCQDASHAATDTHRVTDRHLLDGSADGQHHFDGTAASRPWWISPADGLRCRGDGGLHGS